MESMSTRYNSLQLLTMKEGPVSEGAMVKGTAHYLINKAPGKTHHSPDKHRRKGKLVTRLKNSCVLSCFKAKRREVDEVEEGGDDWLKTVQNHDKGYRLSVDMHGPETWRVHRHYNECTCSSASKSDGSELRITHREDMMGIDCQENSPDSSEEVCTGSFTKYGHSSTCTTLNKDTSVTSIVRDCAEPTIDIDNSEVACTLKKMPKDESDVEMEMGSSPLLNAVKTAISNVSQELPVKEHQQGHFFTPRQRLILVAKPKHSLKYLHSFRFFQRPCKGIWSWMMNGSEYCSPRFADIEARRNTLRDCTDVQRRGYYWEELAHAGWYFNHQRLTTFCCGMEMPVTPSGPPMDVHYGMSPECPFISSLQGLPASQSSRNNQIQSDSFLEAGTPEATTVTESSGIHFSIPVQATDEGTSGASADSFYSGVFQETSPGEHWVTDLDSYGFQTSDQESHATYLQNLVTNRSPLESELVQPYVRSSGGSDSFGQLTGQRTIGGLSMRGNEANPLDLGPETGRRSPIHIPLGDQINLYGEMGEDYRPRYPHFGFPTVRMLTYEGWPVTHNQTPSMMADAGFFYSGYGDSVLCYSCGIGVRHWVPMDDPWIEHARWRPSCQFVKTIQGQAFIDAACEMSRNNRHPTYQEVRSAARSAAQSQEIEEGGAEGGVGGIEEAPNVMCKVCFTNEMNTVLMPCRHLAVCHDCRNLVTICPICRSQVESSFQASFG